MSRAILQDCDAELERNLTHRAPAAFPGLPQIPPGRYVDPRLWELEQQHLWPRMWLLAGHIDDLPERGSYRLFTEIGVPIVLVRGKDDVIRAFYNVCRHRGGPLVHDERGKVTMLSCRFHQWTYDLAGKLAMIPDRQDFPGLDTEGLNLRQVRCELWGSFIFINRDADAEPLLDFLGPIAEEFADLKMDQRRIFKTVHYDLPSNWKIAVASNLESYHLAAVHPNTVHQFIDYRALSNYLYANGHSLQVIPNKTDNSAREASIYTPGADDGADPEHELTRKAVRNYFIFPNILISAAEFQFPIVVYWPIDACTTRWAVHYTAPAGHDDPESAACAQMIAALDIILQEDIANLVWMQKACNKGLIDGMRVGYQERRIYNFEEEVDRRIGAARVPDTLRIKPAVERFRIQPRDLIHKD